MKAKKVLKIKQLKRNNPFLYQYIDNIQEKLIKTEHLPSLSELMDFFGVAKLFPRYILEMENSYFFYI